MDKGRRIVDYRSNYSVAYGWKNLMWNMLQMITLLWGVVSAMVIGLIFFGFVVNVVFGNLAVSQYFKLIEHMLTNPKDNLAYFTLKEIFSRLMS